MKDKIYLLMKIHSTFLKIVAVIIILAVLYYAGIKHVERNQALSSMQAECNDLTIYTTP